MISKHIPLQLMLSSSDTPYELSTYTAIMNSSSSLVKRYWMVLQVSPTAWICMDAQYRDLHLQMHFIHAATKLVT